MQARQGQGGTTGVTTDGFTIDTVGTGSGGNTMHEGDGTGSGGQVTPPPATNTSFFMSVKLDNTRVGRDLQRYLDEVISHLSNTDNCEVELTLEVSAHTPDGFSQGTIRTVSENCRTLHVDNFGFDK